MEQREQVQQWYCVCFSKLKTSHTHVTGTIYTMQLLQQRPSAYRFHNWKRLSLQVCICTCTYTNFADCFWQKNRLFVAGFSLWKHIIVIPIDFFCNLTINSLQMFFNFSPRFTPSSINSPFSLLKSKSRALPLFDHSHIRSIPTDDSRSSSSHFRMKKTLGNFNGVQISVKSWKRTEIHHRHRFLIIAATTATATAIATAAAATYDRGVPYIFLISIFRRKRH